MLIASAKRLCTRLNGAMSAFSMMATSTKPHVAGPNGKAMYHTVTALKRWSCDDKELPPVGSVKAIHIFDFDNTRTYVGRALHLL
jgi:hypothetical protein